MTEGEFEILFKELPTSTNPGLLISRYYCKKYNIQVTPNIIIMFNSLLKDFKRETVLLAVCSMSDSAEIKGSPYGLIKHICLKLITNSTVPTPESLNDSMKSMDKKIKSSKKTTLDIRSPFDDGTK